MGKPYNGLSEMARCRAMDRRRAAATWLLVFCLAVSAIGPFAAPSLSAERRVPLGVSAPAAAPVCILSDGAERSSNTDLQPAIAGPHSCLRLFAGNRGLVRSSDEGIPPNAAASAQAIRGPPSSSHS